MLSLLIVFFTISIAVSFLCSMWEAVLLSITPSYAEVTVRSGSSIGHHLKGFKENIDRPLSAILTLNTIAHTVGAIGVGAQATIIWDQSHPLITAFIVPAVMTLAILIFSEIIPKTLGANHWKDLTPFTVHSLRAVIVSLYPLVRLSQTITGALKKDKSKSVFSRSEFIAMAEIGARTGVFRSDESKILENLLRFHSVRAIDIMTPSTVLETAPEDMSLQELHETRPDLHFSRIPIHEPEHRNHVTGYVLKDEVLAKLLEEGGGHKRLAELRREIPVVPEQTPIPQVLNRFIEKREHIALVMNEFGATAGIVTMEDVIETLLGVEIVDEMDGTVDMQRLARQRWEQRARSLGLIGLGRESVDESADSKGKDDPPSR